MAVSRKTPLERIQERKSSKGVASSKATPKTQQEKLQNQINNYETRLKSIGVNPEAAKDTRNPIEKLLNLKQDQNVLFDIFEIINRPQQALFGALDNMATDEDVWEGFKAGLSGNKQTSGGKLLRDMGMEGSGEFNLFKGNWDELSASDILGFGLDIFADPVDPVLGKAIKGVGKVAKKGVNVGDNLITKGLTKLDEKEVAKLGKAAANAGVDVNTFAKLNNLNLEDFGTRAASYQNLKDSIKDVFKQSDTTLGALKAGTRETKGLNKQFEDVFRKYDDALEDLSYRYVLKNTDVSKYADDISNLKNFLKKDGSTITEWVRKNSNSNLSKAIKESHDTVAKDILNVIQSNKDTAVSGNKVLKQLEKGYTFSGSNESVDDLIKALNEVNETTSAGVQFRKLNKYDDIQNEINSITTKLDSKELSGKALKDAQTKLSKLKDINPNRTESKLVIDNLGKLQKGDPEVKSIFDNLNLNRTWEYTDSELEYLNKLKQNPEFMQLVNKHQNVYKDVSNLMERITGTDYSDIVNRSSYVRKAQGNIGDLTEDINTLDNLIDATPDIAVKEDLQAYRDALKSESLKGGFTPVADRFSSQKYQQPALVANRQYQETVERAQKSVESKIKNLKEQFSDVRKTTLEADIKDLKAIKDGTAPVSKVEKWNKRISKTGERMDSLNQQISEVQNSISSLYSKIDENIIDKSLTIQDKTLSPRLAAQLTKEDNLVKQYDKITKQLNNVENLTEKEAKALASKQRKIGNDLIEASNNARATMDLVDGHIDGTIIKELENNVKNIKKLVNKNSRLADLTSKQGQLSTRLEQTNEALESFTNQIDKQIARKSSELRGLDASKDALIDEQLKHYSTVKSILKDKAGKELFDLNYYAGLDDFVQNAALTNQTARTFRDALTSGVLDDTSIIQKISDIKGNPPKGWKAVSGSKMANNLKSVQNLMGDDVPSELIKDTIKKLESTNYYMDPRAAQLFGIATSKKASTNSLLNLVDRANTTFKKYSVLTPGFQMRNYIGNSTNMYLAGMPIKDITLYQAKATGILNQMDTLMDKLAKGVEFTAEENKAWDLISDFYKGGFSGAGKATRDLEKVAESIQVGKGSKVINKVSDLNMKLNESADAMNRMAMLMYAKDHKKFVEKLGAKNPIQAVKYALMDPSNMSEVEQSVIKRIIPFYTFTKQNLMFQATNIAKNAPRYNRLIKTINKMYEGVGDKGYYKYQKEAMQLPIPMAKDSKGNQLFLKANLPLSDLGEFMSDPLGRVASSTTPLIKIPVELKTGKNLYTGDDTNYKTLSKTLNKLGIYDTSLQNSAQAAETIINGFGLQNLSTNLIKKVQAIIDRDSDNKSSQQLWAEIFRSLVQSTKEENVINSGLYDELEQYQSIVKRLKNQGTEVPTMTQINQVNKMKLNRMKNKRASSK